MSERNSHVPVEEQSGVFAGLADGDRFPRYQCVCLDDEEETGCLCAPEERALRHIAAGHTASPMTPAQREWCRREIASIEGYSESDAEGTDAQVASTVLSAWVDYCRDKGML